MMHMRHALAVQAVSISIAGLEPGAAEARVQHIPPSWGASGPSCSAGRRVIRGGGVVVGGGQGLAHVLTRHRRRPQKVQDRLCRRGRSRGGGLGHAVRVGQRISGVLVHDAGDWAAALADGAGVVPVRATTAAIAPAGSKMRPAPRTPTWPLALVVGAQLRVDASSVGPVLMVLRLVDEASRQGQVQPRLEVVVDNSRCCRWRWRGQW